MLKNKLKNSILDSYAIFRREQGRFLPDLQKFVNNAITQTYVLPVTFLGLIPNTCPITSSMHKRLNVNDGKYTYRIKVYFHFSEKADIQYETYNDTSRGTYVSLVRLIPGGSYDVENLGFDESKQLTGLRSGPWPSLETVQSLKERF